MGATTTVDGVENYVLQETIGAYSDEAYTNAKKLVGTGITQASNEIDTNTETFIGQTRWFKPLTPVINVASITDPTDGTVTPHSTDFLEYVKTVRTHGAEDVNMKKVITQQDGLAKVGRDFAETRAQDEHNAILSVLRGVAVTEALNGAATGSGQAGLGGQGFDNDPSDARYGFYVDLGASKPVVAASASVQGAARAEGFLQAYGMAYKDYEPAYMYLAASPEVMASFRSANLVDNDKVVDGSIEFNTIFQGKFRLIPTRAAQGFTTAQLTKLNTGAGIDITGTKTSFLILPGAIAFNPLEVPMPVEIERKAAAYKGGGKSSIWNRWGYVVHPQGYTWNGNREAFASDADYQAVSANGTPTVLTAATIDANTKGIWKRKVSSALSLGILPVFHS